MMPHTVDEWKEFISQVFMDIDGKQNLWVTACHSVGFRFQERRWRTFRSPKRLNMTRSVPYAYFWPTLYKWCVLICIFMWIKPVKLINHLSSISYSICFPRTFYCMICAVYDLCEWLSEIHITGWKVSVRRPRLWWLKPSVCVSRLLFLTPRAGRREAWTRAKPSFHLTFAF